MKLFLGGIVMPITGGNTFIPAVAADSEFAFGYPGQYSTPNSPTVSEWSAQNLDDRHQLQKLSELNTPSRSADQSIPPPSTKIIPS